MSLGDTKHRRSFADLVIEVILVAIGVFLALLASSWHENREHHAQARAALRNFLGEMQANERAVKQNGDYHVTLANQLDEFLQSAEPMTEERMKRQVDFRGLRPVIFEHTAWDLALATQALSYLKAELAFDIAKVYTQQSAFQTLESSFLASVFTPANFATDNPKGMATAMRTYLGDVNYQEPAVLNLYAKTIPEIQAALGDKSVP